MITKDCPVGLRAIRRRVARVAGAVFATVVALSSAVFGQKPEKKDECKQQVTISRKNSEKGADSVTGSLVDSNGAFVANAQIKITERASQKSFDTISNDLGSFRVASLAAGVYDMVVEASGFTKVELTALTIADKESLGLTVILLPDTSSTAVFVGIIACDEPMVDTYSPGTKTIFKGDLIRKLPIPN